MKIDDKYTTKDKPHPKKMTISNEAYAVCEFIELLIDKIEKARVSLRK